MPKQTREWLMVVELMEFLNEIDSDNAAEFIEKLYTNLDPYMPFAEQVIGDVEKQSKWLYSLYEKYINQDEDAAREVYED